MFVVVLAGEGGGKIWQEYQVKQIVELNREEAKLKADLLSLVDERKILTKEINDTSVVIQSGLIKTTNHFANPESYGQIKISNTEAFQRQLDSMVI
jgi:hypothetical protein